MICKTVALLLVCAFPLAAQTAGAPAHPAEATPIAPAPNEDVGELTARVRYERALRAELDGRMEDAAREARATLEASPGGRFGEAARALLVRVRQQGSHGAPAPAQAAPPGSATERASGAGPRVELVITSTVSGLYLGALAAATASADPKGTAGLVMLGTGLGLAGSLLGSSGRIVPQSMAQLLENGLVYGTALPILGAFLASENGASFGEVFGGAAAGAALGLVASPWLTGGDAGAMTTTLTFGALLPASVLAIGRPSRNALLWTAIVGGTAGLVVGPLVNQHARWSRGRWNLITLGGGVGALMGGGFSVLLDAFRNDSHAGFGLIAAGMALGLGGTALLTQDFGVDEPRPGSAALLHLEGGRLGAGEVLSALAPLAPVARQGRDGRAGGYLRLVDGRF